MICLMVSQPRFGVITMLLYAFILGPLQQLRSTIADLLGVLAFLAEPHRPLAVGSAPGGSPEPWLPVCRFVDVANRAEPDHEDEACSICLMQFEGEDLVSQLSKCGHVFHFECIEKWLDRNNFTCPLCRSSFLHNVNPNSHAKHGVDLNLAFSWH